MFLQLVQLHLAKFFFLYHLYMYKINISEMNRWQRRVIY